MDAFLRKNFARGSLAVELTAIATQMTLEAGHTLPMETGIFRVVIWNISAFSNPADDPDTEIVTASYSGTPNVYNIVRAQENTLSVVHGVGSEVALHYTAGVSSQDYASAIHSNPQSGEYRITGLRLSATGEIVVTYDSTPEP